MAASAQSRRQIRFVWDSLVLAAGQDATTVVAVVFAALLK
jgi:hypothetical protein